MRPFDIERLFQFPIGFAGLAEGPIRIGSRQRSGLAAIVQLAKARRVGKAKMRIERLQIRQRVGIVISIHNRNRLPAAI